MNISTVKNKGIPWNSVKKIIFCISDLILLSMGNT